MTEDLHNQIKTALRKRNMTQRDLADRMGISEVNLSYKMTGARGCSEDTLQEISAILRTPLIIRGK